MKAQLMNELGLVAALAVVVVSSVVVTLCVDAHSAVAIGLPELALALAGGILGAKVPRAPTE